MTLGIGLGRVDLTVDLANQPCTNFLAADGSQWIAEQDIPNEWLDDPVTGTFSYFANSATFNVDGLSVDYSRTMKFGPCHTTSIE